MARTAKKDATKAKGRKQEEVVEDEELDIEDEDLELDDDDLEIEDLDLEDEYDGEEEKDDGEEEASAPKKPAKNRNTKKAGKQVTEPKKDRKPRKGEPPKHLKVPANMVTVKDLEEEFGMKGKEIRNVLRDNDFEKPEGMGRWAWRKSDPDLKRLRKMLADKDKGKTEAAPAKKAAPKTKATKKAPAKNAK